MLSKSNILSRFCLNPALVRMMSVCWNCNESNGQLFCEKCKVLQKPDKAKNYFEIIDLREAYDLDEVTLAKKFKDLQRQLHPDKFSNRSRDEQMISEEYSSLVNKAYSTLLQPLSRGIYMLNLKGLELEEKTQLESKFLMEIMERNEEVENANTPEEILEIEKDNKGILAALQNELNESFKNENLAAAKSILTKMKYYDSINNQIKSIIRRMNIVK